MTDSTIREKQYRGMWVALDAEKGKEMDSSSELSERRTAPNTLTPVPRETYADL